MDAAQAEHEERREHWESTRSLLTDIHAIPGKRASVSRQGVRVSTPGSRRLEWLRQCAQRSGSAEYVSRNASKRSVGLPEAVPADRDATVRQFSRGSIAGRHSFRSSVTSRGSVLFSRPSTVTLPSVPEATTDSVPPRLLQTSSSCPVIPPEDESMVDPGGSRRFAVHSQSLPELHVTLNIKQDGDITLNSSHGTSALRAPGFASAPEEKRSQSKESGERSNSKPPELERTLSETVHEAIDVMTRQGGAKTLEKGRQQDRMRLCSMLRSLGGGSLLRGWRVGADRSGKLHVDWADYVDLAHRLKYHGDSGYLFDNEEHALHLKDLAPDEFNLLDDFKKWVMETFDSPSQFFEALTEKAESGDIAKDVFCQLCSDNDFDGSAHDVDQMYFCIDYTDSGTIKSEDCIFLEVDPLVRQQEHYKVKVGQLLVWKQHAATEYIKYKKSLAEKKLSASAVSAKHRLAPRAWLAETFEKMPTVVAHSRFQRQVEVMLKERNAKKAFINHLVKTYGNEVRAIRRVLSPDGYGFGRQVLRSYIRRLNLPIDPTHAWNALDVDKDGEVNLEEACVHNALILASFQQWASEDPHLTSCAGIWETPEAAAVARKRTGTWYRGKKMLNGVFLETVAELGWSQACDEKAQTVLIGALDAMDSGLISIEDLEWLDRWRPIDWVYALPDPAAWTEFKAVLQEKYGHPLRAWRALLDADDNNNLDYEEFRQACQKVKFKGNVCGAWRALDSDLNGFVTMKQYDAESATLLASFKEWAEATFGSMSAMFKAVDTDRSGSLTLKELKRACTKFCWPGDVRLLFDCIDTDRARDLKNQGKRNISVDELAFLDSWYKEISDAELKLHEEPGLTKRTNIVPSKRVEAITARLCGTTPTADELSASKTMPRPSQAPVTSPAGKRRPSLSLQDFSSGRPPSVQRSPGSGTDASLIMPKSTPSAKSATS